MRLVSYQSDRGVRTAAVRAGELVDLNDSIDTLPADMIGLLNMGPEGIARAATAATRGEGFSRESVRLLAPVPNPQKVICIGLNYADHARESGVEPPPEPVVFNKFPSAVAAPDEPIRLPACVAEPDYEAELVVVIGRGGRNISEQQALEHVVGYCCGHDVSARDWQLQKPGRQWLLGKTFDTFAPFGPELVTAEEIANPNELGIKLRLNGETMQDSSTREFIFNVQQVIAYVSGVCTLVPGDVIFTGTPPGVGMARDPQVFLKPGDVAEVEIEGIGVLRNPVTTA
ncbi:MAG: fumarylacetoacetate hydrolase family protein [Pirellulales bacterium]|nr:fumarylacetoacetate hydrolase family protein [Planctomycetales bacterium]